MAVVVHVDDQVLRLQVPVYDVVRVQVLEAADHLGGVERHVALYGRVHVPDLAHGTTKFKRFWYHQYYENQFLYFAFSYRCNPAETKFN